MNNNHHTSPSIDTNRLVDYLFGRDPASTSAAMPPPRAMPDQHIVEDGRVVPARIA